MQIDNQSEMYMNIQMFAKTPAHFLKGYILRMNINVISNLPISRHCCFDPRKGVDTQIIQRTGE